MVTKIVEDKQKQRYYILVGDKENWEVSIEKKIWGFTERTKGSWNTTKVNEYLAFYVTKPVKKIIGFGKVSKKFINNDLIWKDEKRFKRSIWKYKISFDIIHLCEDWDNGIEVGPELYFLQVSRRVVDNDIFLKLVKKADCEWNTFIHKQMI